jgi:hypothetical protein
MNPPQLPAPHPDRIEDMRRAIGVAPPSLGRDELELRELLGEGTFGKVGGWRRGSFALTTADSRRHWPAIDLVQSVAPSSTALHLAPRPNPPQKVYKGVWRGSTVAVKTMVLPARMSGAEKRERMAVMEAAISSSLSHPNIVQVLRPLLHLRRPGRGMLAATGRTCLSLALARFALHVRLPPADVHVHHHRGDRQPAAPGHRVSFSGEGAAGAAMPACRVPLLAVKRAVPHAAFPAAPRPPPPAPLPKRLSTMGNTTTLGLTAGGGTVGAGLDVGPHVHSFEVGAPCWEGKGDLPGAVRFICPGASRYCAGSSCCQREHGGLRPEVLASLPQSCVPRCRWCSSSVTGAACATRWTRAPTSQVSAGPGGGGVEVQVAARVSVAAPRSRRRRPSARPTARRGSGLLSSGH